MARSDPQSILGCRSLGPQAPLVVPTAASHVQDPHSLNLLRFALVAQPCCKRLCIPSVAPSACHPLNSNMSAPPLHRPHLPELPVAERFKRKELAEAQYPEFPSVPIDDPEVYDAAVKDLLAAAGIARLHVDVAWRNLSCTVTRQAASGPENVFSAFSAIASGVRNGWAKATHPRQPSPGVGKETILDSVSGVLRAGETLLVLGPSGAGSSLLLNRLGHREIGSLVECEGTVLYNGEERLGGVVSPSHIAPMVGQLDVHAPEMTVRQTLQFAANCKVPDWFPYADVLRKNSITVIARILGIERVLDTIVGSQSLRGCSGGERKRVTIAEMSMAQDAGVVLLDNWSKGLDSATTLSICRSIQEYAQMTQTAFVSAMGAPGVDAYDTFSHVCVLDSGKCLYFGPREDAERYFLRMGFVRPVHRSVPDFCSTISDPNVNSEYVPGGTDPSALPLTASELAERYAASPEAAQVQAQLDEAVSNPRMLPEATDDEHTPEDLWKMSRRECLQSLPAQYRAVWGRQITLLVAKKQAFFQALFVNFFFGVILGSVFWQLDQDFAGAGTRGGLVFLAVLFIGLNALSTIDEKAAEKVVYTKMRAAAFFTPFPYISSLLAYDCFTQLLLTVCFAIPLWLLAGMQVGSSCQR